MYLITATLLNAWRVMIEEPYGDRGDFLRTLRREPSEPTEAILKGREFEEWACKNLPMLKGGSYQVKLSKPMGDYLLYGIVDCLKAGVVYDVKYTANYDVGKYLKNYQTAMYLELVPEAKQMVYVVSNKVNDGEIWLESYLRNEVEPISCVIYRFIKWLETTGDIEIYRNLWGAKE